MRTGFIFALIILAFLIGMVCGTAVGYKVGLRDMAGYMLSMVGKVQVNGNVTVGINETKLDQAIETMKNITISILNNKTGAK